MMKNSKMMIGACALAISLGASAQTQYDAARLMGGELNGCLLYTSDAADEL